MSDSLEEYTNEIAGYQTTISIKLKIFTFLLIGLEPDYHQIAPKDYDIHKFNQLITEIKTIMSST